jgi:hypothetical protein
MKKQDVINLLQDMPDEIDVEQLMYHLYVVRKIELGEAAIAAGDVLSEEEVDREIESWFVRDGQDQRSETSPVSETG